MPPVGRSLGRGLLAVVTSPVLLAIAILVPLLTWLALYAIGFEGRPALLVDVLALPPIATYFDLGTGESLLGLGPSFLIFTAVAIAIRGVLYGLLAGMIVESLEDGRVTSWGVLRGLTAIPTVIAVQVLSFTLILVSNIIFPILGPASACSPPSARSSAACSSSGSRRPQPFGSGGGWSRPSGVRDGPRCCPGAGTSCSAASTSSSRCRWSSGSRRAAERSRANPTFFGWVFILAASVLHLALHGRARLPMDRRRARRPGTAGPTAPGPQRQAARRPSGRR